MSVIPADEVPAGLGAQPAAPGALLSKRYRTYALTVLMLIYVLNFLDRQVVSILAEPIKQDLGLHDWQLGMMTGLAFAVLYTFLGLPIARIAERADRPAIIAASVAVWSGFTALCGLAQSFTHLIIARVGVGIGESGCTPPALSLISDYTPREERASAIAFYMLGSPVGSVLGLVAGGLVADAFGWRMAFIAVGLPGLLFALIAIATLAEPRRALRQARQAIEDNAPSFGATLKMLLSKRAYCSIVGAVTLKSFISYGSLAFTASFFFRNHETALAEWAGMFGLKSAGLLGLLMGVTTGVTAIAGTMLGGRLADRLGARDLRAYASIPALSTLAAVPFSVAALLVGDLALALGLMLIPGLLGSMWLGPAYAAVQGLVPANSRATATAVMLFVSNLVGLGLGPLAVGLLSDAFAGAGGMGAAEGIRWALVWSSVLVFPCVWLFWTAGRTITGEMES